MNQSKKQQIKQLSGVVQGVKILVFGAVMAVMCLIGLLWFARPEVSVVEKRTLTKFPSLSWSSFWDGSFFSGLDTWYADTYPIREGLISANQSLQDHYGVRGDQLVGNAAMVADEIPDPDTPATPIPTPSAAPSPSPSPEEVYEDGTVSEAGDFQGNIYITQNAGYGLYYFTQSTADIFAATMNQFYANVGDKVNLYMLIAPTNSAVMLDPALIEETGASNEEKAIEYVFGRMDSGIHKLSVYENLKKHNAEYIYFHTDHHWTALGAYYAYQVFCQEKGITPHQVADYDTVEFDNFLGTFYSNSYQSAELAANPDTVIAYYPKGTNEMQMTMNDGYTYDWRIINDVSDYPNSELYAAFAGGDNPFSYAHNETIHDGSSVVVIKDSYGNAFIPWLVDHYEHIYWIDVRYTYNTISEMVEDYGIQDVIVALNIYNGTTDAVTDRLLYIGQ